ncbi:MAG: pyridoxal-phosphate dependent enzyme [Thermoproteota archaeon]|jgi:Threonine dehydratase
MEIKYLQTEDFYRAKERIYEFTSRTPIIKSEIFSKETGKNVYFKCEFIHEVGSFKIRGVANKVLKEIEEGKEPRMLVTASSGNHGIALAYVGLRLNIPVYVFVPEVGTGYKIFKMEKLGAKIIRAGKYSDIANRYAEKFAKKNNALYVHSYDDKDVIIGQGTIGLEIYEQNKEIDCVVVPVGGGGLIAGIAYFLKNVNDKIKIIGIQSESVPSLVKAIEKNKIFTVDAKKTIAEGMAVRKVGKIAFELSKNYVDEILLVKEEEIINSLKEIFEKERILVEASGASSFAIKYRFLNSLKENNCFVLTGRNISSEALKLVME